MGICGKVLKCIKSILSQRQKVVLLHRLSSWEKVISYVPQGSILRPIVFVIYINDIPDLKKKITATLFAF